MASDSLAQESEFPQVIFFSYEASLLEHKNDLESVPPSMFKEQMQLTNGQAGSAG